MHRRPAQRVVLAPVDSLLFMFVAKQSINKRGRQIPVNRIGSIDLMSQEIQRFKR